MYSKLCFLLFFASTTTILPVRTKHYLMEIEEQEKESGKDYGDYMSYMNYMGNGSKNKTKWLIAHVKSQDQFGYIDIYIQTDTVTKEDIEGGQPQ